MSSTAAKRSGQWKSMEVNQARYRSCANKLSLLVSAEEGTRDPDRSAPIFYLARQRPQF